MRQISSNIRAPEAISHVAERFRAQGWDVEIAPDLEKVERFDLVIQRATYRYGVEIKSLSESRVDRGLAFLSQAILQAKYHALLRGLAPMAVLLTSELTDSFVRNLEDFHQRFATDIAVGVVARSGGSYFIGPGLDDLNDVPKRSKGKTKAAPHQKATDLFSDLNQWLLKVLLAPEIPSHLLSAPRQRYSGVGELANAANVSPMSASRFLQRLREEHFIDERSGSFQIVRRAELFSRWRSVGLRPQPEMRMVFVLPGDQRHNLIKVSKALGGCIGGLAAADLLNLGHVSGAVPELFVRKLVPPMEAGWPGLSVAEIGEAAQILLKRPRAPESVFRGAVQVGNSVVADVLQVWLDASVNPSRGTEQANFLSNGVLSDVFGAA